MSTAIGRCARASSLSKSRVGLFQAAGAFNFLLYLQGQSRAFSASSSSRARKGSKLLLEIKLLESKVSELQWQMAKAEKARAAKVAADANPMTEDDYDQFFQQLMAPPTDSGDDAKLSLSATARMLPPAVIERLGDGTALTISADHKRDWAATVTDFQTNGGFKGLSVYEINRFVHWIPQSERGELVPKILDQLKEAEVGPDVLTYDLLLDGLAKLGKTEEAVNLFAEVLEKGLSPTLHTYHHLLRAFAEVADIGTTSRIFNQMRAAGVEPNRQINTTLIAACVRSKHLKEAQQIFDLMKYKGQQDAPDLTTYNLMIHACSIKQEAERAEELFIELQTRPQNPLKPDATTFTSVIHAYASRKDYYTEAWLMAEKMREAGFELTRHACNGLLQACGKVGDLSKARQLVMEMANSTLKTEEALDIYTFQHLFRAYANFSMWKKNGKWTNRKVRNRIHERTNSDEDVSNVPQLSESEISDNPRAIPFLPYSELRSAEDVIKEAWNVLAYLRKHRPKDVDTHLLNTVLAVPLNLQDHLSLKQYYEEFFASEEQNETPEQGKAEEGNRNPKPPRNGYTFQTALEAAYQARDLKFLRRVWEDRSAWRRRVKTEIRESSSPKRPGKKHHENDQALAHVMNLGNDPRYLEMRKTHDFAAVRTMVNALARCNELEEATRLLRSCEWQYIWTAQDLTTMYVKAKQAEDSYATSLVRKLVYRSHTFQEEGSLKPPRGPMWADKKWERGNVVPKRPQPGDDVNIDDEGKWRFM
ncbi:hypothetical protein YB2330_000150 [Saitoella coloradoensis]